jgi:high affinity Mn2+ porin
MLMSAPPSFRILRRRGRWCVRATRGDRPRVALVALAAAALFGPSLALATPDETAVALPPTAAESFAVHGQLTYVEQETDSFNAPYAGPNSLSPSSGRETFDATLYLGARLWSGAEAWLTPEIDQGFGLNDTLGVAGFPSGEAYKVGRKEPYLRLPRAFVRDTVNLGGESETVDAAPNQLAGIRSADRLVFTVGKFAVTDVFDSNQYAHDPRADFLNWTAIDAGTFDYAADAWGFTVGAAAEWYHGAWALRGGVFDLSNVPNSEHLDPGAHEFQIVLEAERRHELAGQPGKVLVTYFLSRGRMGLLDDDVRLAESTGGPVDIAAVRQYRSRAGVSADLEQQLAADLGLFARAGGAGGNVEAYEFTDVDRSVSAGLSLKGTRWSRAQDTVGVAGIVNGISTPRERYLAAGGLGILIGDGQLPHPGREQIAETYYSLAVLPQAFLTIDYQRVVNPGYNRDRGPVSIVAARLHLQF